MGKIKKEFRYMPSNTAVKFGCKEAAIRHGALKALKDLEREHKLSDYADDFLQWVANNLADIAVIQKLEAIKVVYYVTSDGRRFRDIREAQIHQLRTNVSIIQHPSQVVYNWDAVKEALDVD